MDKYEGKKIAVLGYQVEGKSLVDFLLRKNPATLTILDEKDTTLLPEHEQKKVELVIDNLSEVDLNGFDFIFKSPGINPKKLGDLPRRVGSLTNLFFEANIGRTICVTGTKGKSTTVLLIEQILKENGEEVFVAGNIGESSLNLLDKISEKTYTVLELSSFQLQDFTGKPDYAVILPVFADHLDYHESEQEYYASKRNIFLNSEETVVICAKENIELLGLSDIKNEKLIFSSIDRAEVFMENDSIKVEDKVIAKRVDDFCKRHQIPQVNLLAASALAFKLGMGVDLDNISKNFKKLPMRIELIGEIGRVKFFNDSASTNPISTLNAITILGVPMTLILGGSSKGLALEDFARQIVSNENIKNIYLFGSTRKELGEILSDLGYDGNLTSRGNLAEIFESIEFGSSENVLFSPAFASFDQFRNYKERGEEFNRLFNKLKCKDI